MSAANIAAEFERMAGRFPDKTAVIACRTRGTTTSYERVSFRQLLAETDRFAWGLVRSGVSRGTRAIVLVESGPTLFALAFALFKIGAVPALIDKGMGVQSMVRCLARVDAEAFIGIPRAHVLRLLCPSAFRSARILVTVGGPRLWGGTTLARLRQTSSEPFPTEDTRAEDTAAILFTSGSTGTPKGAVYRHETFLTQVRMLSRDFGFGPDETDIATFPLFALFDAALGVTCVVPDMDASRPGSVRPANILGPAAELSATSLFGSPALLERVTAAAAGRKLPSLRRVISAGAPVHRRVLAATAALLADDAEVFTPYGATEALPIAKIGSRELLSDEVQCESARGRGVCIGRPLAGVTARVIRIEDGAIPEWTESLCLPAGEVGEIVVKGAIVTHEYWQQPEATALAKIREGDEIWHRMGDLGAIDDRGRLWFAGRKAHRVETEAGTLFSVRVEAIFNQVEGVRRTALVGTGEPPRQTPVLCVELLANCARPWPDVREELTALARSRPMTATIDAFLRHPGFPVDRRHNAKISRELLVPWAAALPRNR